MKFTDKVKSVFRKKTSDKFNVYHPEFEQAVEPAFKSEGIQYYRFQSEAQMPMGRYMVMQTLLHAQDLRMDHELLMGYILNMKKAVNGSLKTGINLTEVIRILTQMESRMVQAFEVGTTYALASVIYFDDTEDLYSYDKEHNKKKVAAWKEARMVDFFYTRPMKELLGLSDTSPQDLQQYIDQQSELMATLTSETPES